MLSYQEFKDAVKEHILEYMPNEQDSVVSILPVTKNNDITRDGLIVKNPAENISPTIYLEDFYQDYKEGMSVENCMHKMAVMIDQAKQDAHVFDISRLKDYTSMKQNLYISVVNYDKNQGLLDHVPYERASVPSHVSSKGDLAVIVRALVNQSSDKVASFVINNKMLEVYGISKEQLFADAYNNSLSLMPSSFRSMQDIFAEKMSGMDLAEIMPDISDPPMYVLTNTSNINGASAMLYPGVMDKIYETMGEVAILPSSIHEVIIVPADDGMDAKELEALICLVNDTNVGDMEVLGSKPLTYDPVSKKILDFEDQRKYISEIKSDIAKSGFKPTDKLVAGMRKINYITGEFQGVSGLHKLSKDIGKLENQELKDVVNAAAAECKAQEMARMQPPELS